MAPDGRKVGSLKRPVRSHRSTFPSQNLRIAPCSDHFSQLRCRKVHTVVARSTFTGRKHTSHRPRLEIDMSKKCTPLRREAHVQVKMFKAPHVRTIFGCSDFCFRVVSELTYPPLHYTQLRYTSPHHTALIWHYTKPNDRYSYSYNFLHCTALEDLHRTTLHSITLHFTSLDFT